MAVAVAAGGVGCGAQTDARPQPVPASNRLEQAYIDRVTDGDTVRLRDGRRVRLVQIDAPEVGECFVQEATAVLRRLLGRGTQVGLASDPALDAVDEHGRLLRYVFVGTTNVAVELVARGAATPYFFRGQRGRYASRLLREAQAARAAHRGFWGACRSARLVPEIGFRAG